VTESSKAVFLSYASQDAEAAARICAALRAAGVEVWFDQSSLRGGDAWDGLIRRQVRECVVFMPVISANTDTRTEGYFRLEWRLAVDRSHLMSDDRLFLLPVVIDDTPEPTARVPDRFRERQWSKLPAGECSPAFAEWVAQVVSGSAPSSAPRAIVSSAAQISGAMAGPPKTPSIAVLPLLNISRDEEGAHFADGLAEELLSVLASIPGLRVASRTSSFSFKGTNTDLAIIAGKLNVATLLEGSVRKAGKRVRITAQLIRVADDSHLWSKTYDRELDDIFEVQDDIAQSVVKELRTALMGSDAGPTAAAEARAEVKAATVGRTANAKAYELYLQARSFADKMTEAEGVRSIALYEQALALDPSFAQAWAGLSAALLLQTHNGLAASYAEGYEAARKAASSALVIAPGLAEAHACLGTVLISYDWDWRAADEEFRQALTVAPNNGDVLIAAGTLATALGREEESIRLFRQATSLDPLRASLRVWLGLTLYIFGRYDEAEKEALSVLEGNPSQGRMYGLLSYVRLQQGRAGEALEFAERESTTWTRLTAQALAEHSLGNAAGSDAALSRLTAEFDIDAAFQIAEIHAWRGDNDRAFEWLERAYKHHDPGLAVWNGDPLLRRLHGDQRWPKLLAKMGLRS
jgi:TolB-like protein/Tfp pilus assembly protein PilF